MYKNAMSMEDTVFTMNVADNGSMSGSASANFGSTMPLERSKEIPTIIQTDIIAPLLALTHLIKLVREWVTDIFTD